MFCGERHVHQISIDGDSLTIEDVIAVARNGAKVALEERAKERVRESRRVLEKLFQENQVIYGVNTGFGQLSNIRIPVEETRQLQSNLIRSHSAGVGKPLDTETVRAMMLLRTNTLAKGYSGVRLVTLETLLAMINAGVHPLIPSKGSVGASGDLAPLSHMILVLTGEGKAEYHGKMLNGGQAMEKAGINPVRLDFKEGIALNNGTQLMTGIAALAVHDSETLIKSSEIAVALSLEAMLGISDAFDEKLHKVRPHEGQSVTSANVRGLIGGSQLVQTGKQAVEKLQRPHDPYCLRCAPQVLGAARDGLAYVKKVVEIEINSATDNPLVFPKEQECLSGGNFHGQPVSLAMDVLSMALTMVGNISERRTARLIDATLSNGLPAFLVPPEAKAGLNNGLMTAQCTAAALASENKILAHPACVDSIPTSANFEDFVSMGATAAHKATQILENTQYIVAVELLCAAQAIEFRGSRRLGKGTGGAYTAIRRVVPMLREDRPLSGKIEQIRQIIKNENLVDEIEKTVHMR
jgi:histidine ammonia-lyase